MASTSTAAPPPSSNSTVDGPTCTPPEAGEGDATPRAGGVPPSTSNDAQEEQADVLEANTENEGEGPESNIAQEEDQESEEKAEPSKESTTPPQMEWQAVWSPGHNAYYFYNVRTHETTWVNPLASPESDGDAKTQDAAATPSTAGPSTAPATSQTNDGPSVQPDASTLNGIDPALAYLDPTLYAGSRPSAPSQAFTARFNARTGRFTAMDARDPSHLSESERAMRMSQVYFDVGQWETEVAARKEAEKEGNAGEKRKRPTKKDLERFKEQKKQKKIAKTAWLRE